MPVATDADNQPEPIRVLTAPFQYENKTRTKETARRWTAWSSRIVRLVDTASQRHGGQTGQDPSGRAALLIRLRRCIGAIEGRPITFEPGTFEPGTFEPGTFERSTLDHGVPEDEGGDEAGPAAPAGSGEGPAGGGSARRTPHQSHARWTLGAADIDSRLPGGGLAADTLHEVVAAAHQDGPTAAGFATALIARRLAAMMVSAPHADGEADAGTVLWCAAPGDFGAAYGPGVMHLGLDPGRLLLVRARHDRDVLWAMEEGIRSAALAAVVGEVATADLTHTRRLALAAAETGVPALLVRHPAGLSPSAARTRWQVAASPSPPEPFDARAPGPACWRLELVRCQGGRPRGWTVVWDHEAHRFTVAGDLGHRSAAAAADTPNSGRFGGIMPVRRAG